MIHENIKIRFPNLLYKLFPGKHNLRLFKKNNLDNYIYFLRKRLRTVGSECVLSSVYGSGFILEVKHDTKHIPVIMMMGICIFLFRIAFMHDTKP